MLTCSSYRASSVALGIPATTRPGGFDQPVVESGGIAANLEKPADPSPLATRGARVGASGGRPLRTGWQPWLVMIDGELGADYGELPWTAELRSEHAEQ